MVMNNIKPHKIIYDYSALLGLIVEKYHTRKAFALALGISERSLSLKLNNEIRFTQSEIEKSVEVLQFPPEQIHYYFFTHIVQWHWTIKNGGEYMSEINIKLETDEDLSNKDMKLLMLKLKDFCKCEYLYSLKNKNGTVIRCRSRNYSGSLTDSTLS